jgi:CHAT domain-containing protein
VRLRRARRTPLAAARDAWDAALRSSDANLIEVADRWCAEAVRAGDAGEAADAYWERVAVAPSESARRVPLSHRLLPLIGQHTVAQAGHRQLLDRRLEHAVRLLEFGRGVLMRRSVGAVTELQREALRCRGEDALLTAYQEAVADLAVLIRAQYGRTAPVPDRTIRVGSRAYAVHGDDPLVAAQARVGHLEQLIAELLGTPEGPPEYRDIVHAAGAAPLVYVAASTCGYALLVRSGRPPEHVELPLLTEGDAADQARGLAGRAAGDLPQRQVRTAVAWLTDALAPMSGKLAAEPLLTLVPVGWLALLPLHAALPQAVRYAAGAHAIRPVARPEPPVGTVLVAAAAHPRMSPQEIEPPSLLLVATQARLLGDLYGARLQHVPDASGDEILERLGTADICHFLGHGQADPVHGLSSRLLFADRALSLAEIFAREPLRQRLVVLGACESGVTDQRMPDESVSFPGALTAAGVEGVVAASWRVAEPAAALTLQRFHERLVAGEAPPAALRVAQQWLRTATHGELRRDYPGLWRDRFTRDPDTVPFAEPVHWAAFTYQGT